jgi:hypothetical protein
MVNCFVPSSRMEPRCGAKVSIRTWQSAQAWMGICRVSARRRKQCRRHAGEQRVLHGGVEQGNRGNCLEDRVAGCRQGSRGLPVIRGPVISNAAGVRQYVTMVGKGAIGVDARTGKLLWHYNRVANDTAVIPTPLVWDDYVFVSSGYGTGAALLKIAKSTASPTSAQLPGSARIAQLEKTSLNLMRRSGGVARREARRKRAVPSTRRRTKRCSQSNRKLPVSKRN